MADSAALTVVIADDHEVVRQGIRAMLERFATAQGRPVSIAGEAANGIEAIRQSKALQPDLLVLDVAMPYARGIEVFTEIRRWSPNTRIVAMTGMTSTGLLKRLVDAGIDGVFLKGGESEEFLVALPQVLSGTQYVAADVAETLADAGDQERLSRRELQVLSLIVGGQSNGEIADALSISTNTVNNHRASIMRKLNVHSMAELMAYALREGLLDASRQL
jgi:DNA-binding NarL/FixJ family response regulator